MPPKAASRGGENGGDSAPKRARAPSPPSTLPPQIPELPVTWEDTFVEGHSVDPSVPLPLEAYDEEKQLQAPRGSELRELLEEDARLSAAYTAELARLQSALGRHERATTDMVKYLEAEVRRKDLMSKRMSRQLSDLRVAHAADLAAMERHFESTGKFMEKIFLDKERQMLARTEKLEKSIGEMGELASMRTALAAELEATKQLVFSNERTHKLQLDELEKRFLAARDGLQSEAAARITNSRATYKLEVGRELEQESAAVRAENTRARHNLRLHSGTSDRLQREHAAQTARIYTLKQDLELRTQQNEEYARKAARMARRIESLTRDTAALEKTLVDSMAHAEQRKVAHESARLALVAPLQSELTQARSRAGAIDAANKSLRREARRALAAKKELERFFLLALDETRQAAKRREELKKKEAALLQAAQLRELTLPPSLRTKLPLIHGNGDSSASASSSSNGGIFSTPLSLSDLTLDEREKALRLLYAKIAHVPSGLTLTLPPHSFDISISAGEGQAAIAGQGAAPLLSLPATPPIMRPPGLTAAAGASSAAAAALPSSPPLPQLLGGDDFSGAAAPSATVEAPSSAYDSTFLTNFRADDDDAGAGADSDGDAGGVEDVD